jgi:hypothetical protein
VNKEHPFAIPEHVAKRIEPCLELMREPGFAGQDLPILSPSPHYGLHLFNELEEVLGNLQSVSAALDMVRGDLSENQSRYACLIHAISLGLERELMRGQAVFDWALATWEYDPAIQRLNSRGSIPPEQREKTLGSSLHHEDAGLTPAGRTEENHSAQ